jgi:hypothetical protein
MKNNPCAVYILKLDSDLTINRSKKTILEHNEKQLDKIIVSFIKDKHTVFCSSVYTEANKLLLRIEAYKIQWLD